MVLGSFGKTFSVRTLNMLQSTFYRACNRSLSSAEWLSRWGEALGKKHCKMVTAAGMLGKPLERTRARVANEELPVVIRDGERLIPTAAVVRLHEQLLGKNPSSLSPESNDEAPGARQHQSPTSSWPNNEPRGSQRGWLPRRLSGVRGPGSQQRRPLYEVRGSGLLHVFGLGFRTAPIVAHARPGHEVVTLPMGRK